MNKTIYDTLKKVAKAQGVTTYSDIAPLAGLDMSSPHDRNQIAEILGDISKADTRSDTQCFQWLLSIVTTISLAKDSSP